MTELSLLDPPATAIPTVSTGPLADLILTRLLTEKKSLGEKKLLEDLEPFFRRNPSTDQYSASREGLRLAGHVHVGSRGGLTLTEAGRSRALEYLGVSALPPRSNWGTIKAKFLVPKALGLSHSSSEDAKLVGDSGKLAALLLKRKLKLPVGTGSSLGAVLEAIACREAGYPEQTTLKGLQAALLGKAVKSADSIDGKLAAKVVPQVLLDTPKKRSEIENLRAVALRELVADEIPPVEPETNPTAEPVEDNFDLEAFAHTVKAAARTSPSGWFGDNKVFISHVWRQLAGEPVFERLDMAGFKQKLIEANRGRLLTLSRADLVQVMDPADVRESEIEYLNAQFHFILVEKE